MLGMRQVSSSLQLDVRTDAHLVFSVAVAQSHPLSDEHLDITLDGAPLAATEITDVHGTRLHRVAAGPGRLEMTYAATVGPAEPAPVLPADDIVYLRPSRYCDSDRLANTAYSHLGDATGQEVVEKARQWMLGHIVYAPGSSGPADGALETYLHRAGVCRDTSHLLIAFLRARGVPARLVSAYSPGLQPMDFHAVVEVLVDGAWWVIDGTGLASRPDLVRIATGRDAADTAFLTVLAGNADLRGLRVDATNAEGLTPDDGVRRVQLR
ncbi:putative transglutaminase-like protein [Nocardioides phosphati]|uniref:Transglutaminase-like protein n=2 Tax=Nocardioides phosphati TaxID=1867775 RepID=A0ABQ2N905_9ACTN|nr:putative transglutaminase-like protein [Nocardioides phosphati]